MSGFSWLELCSDAETELSSLSDVPKVLDSCASQVYHAIMLGQLRK